MMRTRRSLFAWIPALLLLLPATAFAQQPTSVMVAPGDEAFSIMVTWQDNSTPAVADSHYVVEYRDVDTSNWMSAGTVDGNTTATTAETPYTATIMELDYARTYEARVAYDADGAGTTAQGDWVRSSGTGERSRPQVPPMPAKPTGLSAEAGDGEVMLSWNADMNATMYKVQWKTSSQSFGVTGQEMMVEEEMATIKDLENGMTYMFQVMGKNEADMYGPASDTVEAMPTAGEMMVPAPTNVKLEPGGRKMITAKWDYGGEGTDTATGFQIGWTEAAGNMFTDSLSPQRIVSVTGGREARSYTLELKVNDDYLIAVRAVHGDATGDPIAYSDWSYRAAARESTPAVATKPQNVTVSSMDGALMVTWDAVASVAKCEDAAVGARCGYLVEWRAAHQSFDNPDRQMKVRDKLSATIEGLDNGTEYGVVVSSMNEKTSKSDASIEARQTPMMPTPALPVFGVLALGAGLVAAGRRRLRAQRQRQLKA